MKLEKIITAGLIIMAVYSVYAVTIGNPMFVG
jgi:hypothetical protein